MLLVWFTERAWAACGCWFSFLALRVFASFYIFAISTKTRSLKVTVPNTVFARAFTVAIQSAHKDLKNKHAVNRAIILFTQHPHYLCYFSLLLNAVYWLFKSFITKISKEPSNSQLLLCYRKNTVKCSACAAARKIESDSFCRNLPISNDPVVKISRNLAKKIVQKSRKWSITKNLNFNIGNF